MQRFLDALDELSDAAEALVSPPADGAREAARTRHPRVLLLASDASVGERLRDLLAANGEIELVSETDAASGAAARRPDLIVGHGTAALDTVQGLHQIAPKIPALLVVPASALPEAARSLATDPVILLRDPVLAEDLAAAARALLAIAQDRRGDHVDETAGAVLQTYGEPRSYAHLAGLIPRALERSISFDVSATVICRTEGEPIVELYAVSDTPDETLRTLRELAVSLCRERSAARVPAAGVGGNGEPVLKSVLDARIEAGGRIAGVILIASFGADAFSPEDERILAAFATRASSAYRRLEASLTRLRLTPRQSQVLSLIASGHSDKEIAARLGVSHRTVRTHLDRLLREHGLHSRTEAVAAWLRSQQA
jgi:DNA-binding NarL/FixJ family response regulator